ncbi:peptidylprolyl isomerase [Streptomyces sp. MAR4 CNX-425]|uniref:peptidylprolyl isomerase n=1 Tax=Streptomyces sp. MAR4 CNX-425 TaxID=3406343 RepID=UPI003B5144EE
MVSRDQRRRQLAREKYERQQRRRADRRKHNRKLAAIIAAPLVVVITAVTVAAATGFGSDDDDKKKDDAAAPSASPSEKPHDPCGKPEKGKASKKTWKKEPKLDVDESATYTMTLSTTCGDIGIEMDAGKAPHTVNNMRFLAGEGYFDHSPCHRLTNQGIFVLQCGDPAGTGQGGPGYTIPDENLKDKSVKGGTYPAGTVAMANTGQKDSGGSQFFLVYQDSQLPPNYTPFGTLTEEGTATLKMIAEAGAQPPDQTGNTAPNATVVINKATVTEGTKEQETDH